MEKIFNSKKEKQKRKDLRNNVTPHEIILWSRLRRSGLGYKFRRQQSIGRYVVDFYCPEKRLVIEIDGWQHKENEAHDNERTAYLESFGLEVLRFWNNEVNDNLDGVILRIEEHLR